jgi:ribosomal 50S subunit-recycling heat shock protein
MRVDKYLKNARIIKRRTIAKEACDQGRVLVNGREAKPGTELKVGDELLIRFGTKEMKIRVSGLDPSPRKEDAADMYEVL